MQDKFSYVNKCIEFTLGQIKLMLPTNVSLFTGPEKNVFELNGKVYYIRTSNAHKNSSQTFLIDTIDRNAYDGFVFVKYCGKKDIQIWGFKKSQDILHIRNNFYTIDKNELDDFFAFINQQVKEAVKADDNSTLFMKELNKLCYKFGVDPKSIITNIEPVTTHAKVVPEVSLIAPKQDKVELILSKNNEVFAEAVEDNGSFIVKAGSKASTSIVPSLRKNIRNLRTRLEATRIVSPTQDCLDCLVFNTDYKFKTLSEAGCFILGREVNGRDLFKVKGTNESYNEYKGNNS